MINRGNYRRNVFGCAGAAESFEACLWEAMARFGWRMHAYVELDRFPLRKSAPEKVQLAAITKAATSVSNGWLARRLHIGEPATVSQYVRRYRLAGSGNEPAYLAALSIIKT